MTKRCDLLIRNGTVIDGTRAASFRGDLAVSGSRIAAVGDLTSLAADHEVDATSRVVAPGFIDVHTHDDHALLDGPMTSKVSQGVTTVVAGNCGVSLAPLVLDGEPPAPLRLLGKDGYRFGTFGAYVAALEARPAAVNAVLLVGHSTLRVGTMSDIDRPASPDEIAAMRGLLREALDAGAAGFSTGLFLPCRPRRSDDRGHRPSGDARAARAPFMPRTCATKPTGSKSCWPRASRPRRRAAVPLIVSHHKCMGRANFGRSSRTLALIDRARHEQPVGLDVYPYTAGSTELLPAMIGQASRIIVTWSRAHPELAGRDLADIAAAWGVDQAAAAARLQPAGAIYFMMDEADVQRIMAYPHSMIGSDGLPHDEHPHPRLWGTFPRVLGRYVRELGLLTLEDAVHRMTGLGRDSVPAGRSWRVTAWGIRRHRHVRRRDGRRPGHLRGTEDPGRRHRSGRGQRRDRLSGWPGRRAPGRVGCCDVTAQRGACRMSRILTVGAAQMGPIARAETRAQVVARMLDLMRQAHAMGCELVVFPELALTTFFPRWHMERDEEIDAFFETEMPSAETRPLFEQAARLSVGFYLGYAELTVESERKRRFNTSILVDGAGRIVGKYRKIHLPGHAEHEPWRAFQHLEKRYFEIGDLGFGVWRAFGGIMGMCICNDRRWPETYRVMGLQGVEMVLLGYNTPVHNPPAPEHDHLGEFHNQLSHAGGCLSERHLGGRRCQDRQ